MTKRMFLIYSIGFCFALSTSLAADVDPWLKALTPVPLQKSRFPSPQLWPSQQGEFTIPLTLSDTGASDGRQFITTGVPLMVGQAHDISELHLAMKEVSGSLRVLPAQFRVLARWWRFDKSIRWVLVDFQADISADAKLTFVLTNRKLKYAAPPARLIVEQSSEAIVITTGPARFQIDRKAFNLLDGGWVDANQNGRFSETERIVNGNGIGGGITEDTSGNQYLGSIGCRSVEVVESGPMRVRVRARGQHIALGKQGYKAGMYDYDALMDFYADSTEVFVDYVVGNNPPTSRGCPAMEDASVKLGLSDPVKRFLFVDGTESPEGEFLDPAASACLYQDSNGADTWAACPGFGNMNTRGHTYPSGTVTAFRGWKIYSRDAAGQRKAKTPENVGKPIANGDRARGLAVAACAKGGVVVNVRNFWRLFPKAIEIGPDRVLRIALLPRESKVVHFIEDASASSVEFVLGFYAGSKEPSDLEEWADRWDHRVIARPPMEHMADCGALADTGPFIPPLAGLDQKPNSQNEANGKRMFTRHPLYGNAYGWQVWGERWRSNGGHGRRGARQPIEQDNYLWLWYVTGNQAWFEIGEARSRHFRDVRFYRIENQDPFGFKDWKAFQKKNRSEKWTNRPQPKGEDYAAHRDGHWKRTDWPFPNPEHTTLDLLYDRYLLFGDERCLENMKIAAAHGGYFAGRGGNSISNGSWPWRAHGWGWRALLRYWELTGDAAAEECLSDIITRHSAYIGKTPFLCQYKGKPNWWFTQIYSRALAMTALQTGDPKTIELCKTLAYGKETELKRFSTLFSTLYYLTGEVQYKQKLLGAVNNAQLGTLDRYWTICDSRLLNTPPGQAVPLSNLRAVKR